MNDARPAAILLMGPTATGKSDLAIALAERLGGEIVSVDSALVYRGMDIGTAKPSAALRRRVPHHLIDLIDPAEAYSVGRFVRDARRLMAAIASRGGTPILAGGTMLYFNALLHGLADLPAADPDLRRALEEDGARRGWDVLHGELARVDPESARRIHPNDPQRIQRALEVWHASGRTLSALSKETAAAPLPCRPEVVVVAPASRADLAERIVQRFDAMLAAGFLDEVRALYARGDLHADLPSVRAAGYRQAWAYLAGECDFATFRERAVAATRQLAKRQLTWLKRDWGGLRYAPGPAAEVAARITRDLAGTLDSV